MKINFKDSVSSEKQTEIIGFITAIQIRQKAELISRLREKYSKDLEL